MLKATLVIASSTEKALTVRLLMLLPLTRAGIHGDDNVGTKNFDCPHQWLMPMVVPEINFTHVADKLTRQVPQSL